LENFTVLIPGLRDISLFLTVSCGFLWNPTQGDQKIIWGKCISTQDSAAGLIMQFQGKSFEEPGSLGVLLYSDFFKLTSINRAISVLAESSPKIVRIDAIKEPNGHLGCLKSHIKALNYALQNFSTLEYVLICEDDFYIKDMIYCEKMLNSFFSKKLDWDVLMLAHNTVYLDYTTYSGVIKIIDSQTASGYLIKTEYIPKLLNIYQNDLNMYNKTGKWTDNYCTDQSWKQLQKTTYILTMTFIILIA
jgi:hypothetical protein